MRAFSSPMRVFRSKSSDEHGEKGASGAIAARSCAWRAQEIEESSYRPFSIMLFALLFISIQL